ncbi:MAG: cysteine protease [SAR86 cluster bacterium]|uniref:Cysteine protease n=1 Tax=SAR86 cluster bacterium TaxID=2030880 RepID=A0A2A5CGZ2_9GAMM|nr:transglutaminase family protein [bacterium AH-315-I11]MBN4059765.1 transglutaminase family protein [bacterium AH-315-I11]MBN4075291.1 transglutaminase family protein [Gammaproteobacteria bacterium AH-315-E17]PCJ42656.1 MAG: cysteine protease [SAR86 cluster bacterium]
MKRYKILHQTSYEFTDAVQLLPHTLRLRPREGHELRIESSILNISPEAALRWHRDVEGNSVATATFNDNAQALNINSEIIIQKYDQVPHDFLVADYAVDYPFNYSDEDQVLLSPYMGRLENQEQSRLNDLVNSVWQPNQAIQTFALLLRLNQHVYQAVSYKRREEAGVQTVEETLTLGSGSCRDSAFLFMLAAQQLGFAARFISGYIYSEMEIIQSGSTHAWAEVFIPGAGWKGFDPSIGNIVGVEHIAVAVARLPESVPPVSGSFHGLPGANMTVNVWVTELL